MSEEIAQRLSAIEHTLQAISQSLDTLMAQKKAKRPVKDLPALHPAFVQIWELYGKKVGNISKLNAKIAALPSHTIQHILNHIPAYVQATPDIQYRKNLETYLNNKSWQDEIYQNNNNGNNYRKNTLNELDAVFAAKYGN